MAMAIDGVRRLSFPEQRLFCTWDINGTGHEGFPWFSFQDLPSTKHQRPVRAKHVEVDVPSRRARGCSRISNVPDQMIILLYAKMTHSHYSEGILENANECKWYKFIACIWQTLLPQLLPILKLLWILPSPPTAAKITSGCWPLPMLLWRLAVWELHCYQYVPWKKD